MAKKNRYRKGGPARLDMRKGGRVALYGGSGEGTGGGPSEEELNWFYSSDENLHSLCGSNFILVFFILPIIPHKLSL